jgi:DNA (cytosine-5)-methyltransferase 1
MTFGGLFSGIGGLDLGLERAGMECKWQVEVDPFRQKVLGKHWPKVKRYGDIRSIDADDLERVDLIAGGFPCQDVSKAGHRKGIRSGNRSGLWSEFHRIIRSLRPKFVLVENVTGLLTCGLGGVLGDLAQIGYDAEWSVISACSVGAPHTRERVFIVAHPEEEWRKQRGRIKQQEVLAAKRNVCFWKDQPEPQRVADGISYRMDRLGSLGDAVVPHVAESIGRMILNSYNHQ